MAASKLRRYRQGDELYGLLEQMAIDLGTNRTTVIELAVMDLTERMDSDREALIGRAREIDEGRRAASLEAMMAGRERHGLVRRRKPTAVRQ